MISWDGWIEYGMLEVLDVRVMFFHLSPFSVPLLFFFDLEFSTA
jgi:hypothetical protein